MTIFEDLMTAPGSHKTECAQLNRCVCGQEQCQLEDFERRLKQAMAAHPELTGLADSDGGECD
jgi:hypothetical protein